MFVSVPSKLQTSRPEAYIRMQTSDQIIDGFVNKFGILLMIGKPTSFSGYEPISSGSAIDMSFQSAPSSFYDFEDLVAGKGNARDVGGKNNTWVRLLNTNLGSDITVTAQNSSESNLQTYLVESRKGVIFNFTDENGAVIQGAKLHMADTDHGSRLAANQVGTNASYLADKVYTGTSNVSGTVDFSALADSILLSLHYSTNLDGNPIYDIFDSRGNSNDVTDVFTFNSISYNHSIASVSLILKGNGTLVHDQSLITDFSITEVTESLVVLYNELQTPEKLYDYSKQYLVDNYAGEKDTIFRREGSHVTTGSYNVSFDASYSNTLDIISPTPDATIVKGSNINLELVSSNITIQDAAIHCEFTTGSDVTTGQIIWETGGATVGTVLAIQSGVFKIYSGSTGSEQSNSVAVAPNTKYSSTVIIDLTNDEIRFYLNANSKRPTKSHLADSVSFTESTWAGSNEAGVGENNNGVRSPFTGSFLGLIKNNSIYVYQTNEISDTLDTIEIRASSFSGDMTAGGVITVPSSVAFSGVRTDQNGSVFPTRYITLTNIPVNAEVRIYDEDNDGNTNTLGIDREGVESNSSSTYVMPHAYQESGDNIIVQILALGYEELTFPITLTTENQSFNVSERLIVEENL